tara:strand:+ start:330 stop:839 length:510 start_codon:yes stop_codon:yes gene_type:complete
MEGESPRALNPATLAYLSRNSDVKQFHENNLREGFIMFKVELYDDSMKATELGKVKKNICKLDEIANPAEKHPRLFKQKKPYFRYIAIQPDGSHKCYGGGYYLYTGWSPGGGQTRDAHPVYFRAKSAIRNSNVPNFSIQWNKVAAFYYKPAEAESDLKIQHGGKVFKLA